MALEKISFVASSNIEEILYNPEKQALFVRFKRGHIFRYPDVTGEEAGGFGQSMSAGQYLRQMIEPMHTGERVPSIDSE